MNRRTKAAGDLGGWDKYVAAECYTDDIIEMIDDKTPLAEIVGDLAVDTDKLPFIGVTMNDPPTLAPALHFCRRIWL